MTQARDLLDETRLFAHQLERLHVRLESMERASGVKAQGYEPRVSGTRADVNGTDATVARLDATPAILAQVKECEGHIQALYVFLYGRDGHSGACQLVGFTRAGVLWDFYGRGLSWATVSNEWQLDARHAAEVACDLIDSAGIASASMGLGIAEG